MMIKFSKEFYKKSFTAGTMKEAYLSACKWYSTNVLSKAEFSNVQVQFIKEDVNENKSPTITIRLFAVQDGEEEVMNQHCECCKEAHRSFFLNGDTQCNRCNAMSYHKRIEQRINIKKDWYRELLAKFGGIIK